MQEVFILVDSDREPAKVFRSMDAAKRHCQDEAATGALITWEDHPEWSWGSIPNGPEWSILIMPVHGPETSD